MIEGRSTMLLFKTGLNLKYDPYNLKTRKSFEMGAQGFYLFPSHYLPNYKVNEMRREGAIKKDEEATLIMLVTFQLGIVYIHAPKNLDKPH